MTDLAALSATRSATLAARLNARRKRVGLVELSSCDVVKYVMAAQLDLKKAEAMYNVFMTECSFLKKSVSEDFVDALQDGIFMLPANVVHVFDGSAIAVLVPRNFSYGGTDLDKLKRSIVFQIMQVANDDNVKANGVSVLIDCNGALYSRNWSAWLGRWLLNALEHMLPVALAHVYFVRPPLWMNMSVLGLRMFMSASVSTRVQMLDDLDLVLEKKYQSLTFRADDSVYALMNKPAVTYPEFMRKDEVQKQEQITTPAAVTPTSAPVPEEKLPPPQAQSSTSEDAPLAMPTTAEPAVADPPQMRPSPHAEMEDGETATVYTSGPSLRSQDAEESLLGYADYCLEKDFCDSMLKELERKSSGHIKAEYDEITQANASSYESQRVENEHKNRYTNIMAYDHSRVKLKDFQQLTDPEPTDYINANFVAGYDRECKYIATQGPLRFTAHAFWLMVFEQRSNTIVMVTREKEKKRIKCERYWPETQATNEYGGGALVVTNEAEEYAEEYIVRRFRIESGGESLIVNHFQYTGWPDFGVPEGEDGTGAMLHFWIELVLKSQMECGVPTAPIITHCSAGIGRTGTLILLDRTLEELHKGGTTNLRESLQTMRNFRYGLVMTAEQYNFVYLMLEDYLYQIYEDGEDHEQVDDE